MNKPKSTVRDTVLEASWLGGQEVEATKIGYWRAPLWTGTPTMLSPSKWLSTDVSDSSVFVGYMKDSWVALGLSAIFLGGTVFGSTVLHAVSPCIHDESILEILKIAERMLVVIAASLLVYLVGLNAYKLAKRETSKLE